MRNLLVDAAGRVAVLDTRARWAVPIELDLATLLVALRSNRLQWLTGGRAWSDRALRRYEAALLDGAGIDRAARAPLLVFELLVLWDAWAAHRARTVARARTAGGVALQARLLAGAAERRFRATSAALLEAVGRA
jgi:hypothetical protein